MARGGPGQACALIETVFADGHRAVDGVEPIYIEELGRCRSAENLLGSVVFPSASVVKLPQPRHSTYSRSIQLSKGVGLMRVGVVRIVELRNGLDRLVGAQTYPNDLRRVRALSLLSLVLQ